MERGAHAPPRERPLDGRFTLANNARYEYTIEAWTEEFGTWRTEIGKKVDAGQRVQLELVEGRGLVEAAFDRSNDKRLKQTLAGYDAAGYEGRVALLRSEEVSGLMRETPTALRRPCTGDA